MKTFLPVFEKSLPEGLKLADLENAAPHACWGANPEQAAIQALALSGCFDSEDYLRRYPDVASAALDPLMHYVRHGLWEGRTFNLPGRTTPSVEASGRRAADATNKALQCEASALALSRPAAPAQPFPRPESAQEGEYSVIITLWKRKGYLREQYLALQGQSVKPSEIIYVINENHISPDFVRANTGPEVKIIQSDVNSLYTRFAMAYMASGEFVTVVDDDVIPGEYWFANALRCCRAYNAYVVGSGRLYNRCGHLGFAIRVSPFADEEYNCTRSDVYCDWGCNSYFFRRKWLGAMLSETRPERLQKYTDDMSVALNLFNNFRVPCVVPMQPLDDRRFHASLVHEYGEDAFAVSGQREDHFAARKRYMSQVLAAGYTPVQSRDNLYRFHIITPFGDRDYLERCLLSIKGQVYENYTCTLIDDCCDGQTQEDLLKKLGLCDKQFRYIRNKQKLYALRGHEIANDLLNARLADVIVHLDGDDWFAHPHVLSELNRIYRKGTTLATYGSAVASLNQNDRRDYQHIDMSRRWNMAQTQPRAPLVPVRRVTREEMAGGWQNGFWWMLHLRSFQYVNWLEHSRSTFRFRDGRQVKYAYDAAIMIPILNSCPYQALTFVPDINYIYQRGNNETWAKKREDCNEAPQTRRHINLACQERTGSNLALVLSGKPIKTEYDAIEIRADTFRNDLPPVSPRLPAEAAICTIVTPDFVTEALAALASWQRNSICQYKAYALVCTEDRQIIANIREMLKDSGFIPLFPSDLDRTPFAAEMASKYRMGSDEYRWGMKSVLLAFLLSREHTCALFLDPDIYCVSNIDDIVAEIGFHSLSLFSRFRNPDRADMRSAMYNDGFYSGSMLGATRKGMGALEMISTRFLREMKKDLEHDLFVDQQYFDTLPMEYPDIFISLDKGINYNAVWNKDAVEGFTGPSQRSYLLQSGFFARVWHVSSMLCRNAIENLDPEKAARPMVGFYIYTKLLAACLLCIRCAAANLKQPAETLKNRCARYCEQLARLSRGIDCRPAQKLLEKCGQEKPAALLKEWTDICLSSICFDNLEMFARLLLAFFPREKEAQNLGEILRRRDLRYIAEDVLGNPDLKFAGLQNQLEAEHAGVLIKKRLAILRNAGIGL